MPAFFLNAAIISFFLSLIFRALAVAYARKNSGVSDNHMSASKREIVPFNSPCQLVREVRFFGATSKLTDRLGLLSRMFVRLIYMSMALMLAFLYANLFELP